MLGFLHKCVLRNCHPVVLAILTFAPEDVRADYRSKALHSFGELVNYQGRL